MNKFLEELRTLDTKNPGGWPWPIKIAALALIFLVIFAAAYFLVYQGQQEELEKEKKKEDGLRATFMEKQKLAVNLEAFQQQRAEIEQSFGALLKQLPTKSQVDALIIDINQAGLGRGLQFELFKPSQAETMTEFYAERPINLKVVGNYHDLGAFASDVSKLPRIVLLNDLKVDTPKEGSTGPLSMEAVARTFRYLDPEEVAAQKKTAKDAQKKAGGK
jgi:type IV pilus assembly protein PilO